MKPSSMLRQPITFAAICLITLVFSSCKEDEAPYVAQPKGTLIEESRKYFETSVSTSNDGKEKSISRKGKNLRQFASKNPLWNEAFIKKISVGNAVVIPLSYNDATIYTKAGSQKQALSLNNISYLMIYKNKQKRLTAEMVTWIPDDEWWDNRNIKERPFTGKVIVEDWKGNFIKGYRYKTDGTIEFIKSTKPKSDGNESSVESLECIETDWYICFSAGGYKECRYEYTETSCSISGGGGGNDYGGEYWGDNGGDGTTGGGTNPTDYPPAAGEGNNCPPVVQSNGTAVSRAPFGCDDYPEEVPEEPVELMPEELLNAEVFVDDKPGITDVQKYIDCFTRGVGQSYKLTIYVNQPLKGTNSQYITIPKIEPMYTGLGLKISGFNYDVGHVFVGFEKTNQDGTVIRQVIGFYPESAAPSGKGIVKDNSGDKYDVNYSINVDADQFQRALAKMKQDHNEASYVLGKSFGEEYNCADAAIDWLKQANIELPSASRGQFINTPGDFGQALSGISGASTTSGNAPLGTGPCN